MTQTAIQSLDVNSFRAEAENLLSSSAEEVEILDETQGEFEKIGVTYGELIEMDLPPREEIIFVLDGARSGCSTRSITRAKLRF